MPKDGVVLGDTVPKDGVLVGTAVQKQGVRTTEVALTGVSAIARIKAANSNAKTNADLMRDMVKLL